MRVRGRCREKVSSGYGVACGAGCGTGVVGCLGAMESGLLGWTVRFWFEEAAFGLGLIVKAAWL